jgi:hypothetical protein
MQTVKMALKGNEILHYIIIQLTHHRGFSVTDYIKYYAYLCYVRRKMPSPLLNSIEQCFATHVVHTCQQY